MMKSKILLLFSFFSWTICLGQYQLKPRQIPRYFVDEIADISSTSPNEGDYIEVGNVHPRAIFKIKNSTSSRFIGVGAIPTANGKFAEVQPIGNKYHANHFGAIPSDGQADDFYIQEAINYILIKDPQLSSSISSAQSTLVFGAGKYQLDTGVVMNRTVSTTDKTPIATFETLTLEGVGYAYGDFNATTIEFDPFSFGIGSQGCRNCVIKNMAIFCADGLNGNFSKDTLLNYTNAELATYFSQFVRTDGDSPNAAIVIDPFSNGSASKYPLWSTSYSSSFSETSQFTIEGVSIAYSYVGIAINPGGVNQNGDNIRLTNSHVEKVGIGWYTRSSQSRQNSIDNIYIFDFGTLVANDASGTPPSIRNVNGAGIIRQIFDVTTGFGPIRMDNCYFEGLFSIGTCDATYTSFNQCQFKFNKNVDEPIAYLTLNAGSNPVYFNDCSVQFFSNGVVPVPLYMNGDYIEFRRCHLEVGGIINSSLPDQRFDMIKIYDSEFYAPFNANGSDLQIKYVDEDDAFNQVQNQFIGSGDYSFSQGGWTYSGSNGWPFYLGLVEASVEVTRDTLDTSGLDTLVYKFTATKPGSYQKYDNIISSQNYTTLLGQVVNDMVVGWVIKIEGDTIYCGYPPSNGPNTFTATLYQINPEILTLPFWGDIASGEDTVRNVYGYQPSVGIKIRNGNFPAGTYIKTMVNDSTYVMSNNATATISEELIVNTFPSAKSSSTSPGTGYIREGSEWKKRGVDDIDYLRCTKAGIFGDATNPPEWADTSWYNRGPFQNDTIIVSTSKSVADVDYNVGNEFLANVNLQEINLWVYASAGNSQVLLPATSTFYEGKRIRVIATETGGNVQLSAGGANQILSAGVNFSLINLSDGDTVTLICMEDPDDPGIYLWVIQN